MFRLFKPPEWDEWAWYQRLVYLAVLIPLLLGIRWFRVFIYRWLEAH